MKNIHNAKIELYYIFVQYTPFTQRLSEIFLDRTFICNYRITLISLEYPLGGGTKLKYEVCSSSKSPAISHWGLEFCAGGPIPFKIEDEQGVVIEFEKKYAGDPGNFFLFNNLKLNESVPESQCKIFTFWYHHVFRISDLRKIKVGIKAAKLIGEGQILGICMIPEDSNCNSFKTAFNNLGEIFADFCKELPKKQCNWRLTSGPLHKHLTVRSMIARAHNRNSFPVNVQLIVMLCDAEFSGQIIPFHCQELVINPCGIAEFDIIDTIDVNKYGYIVFWELTVPEGESEAGSPVCDNVFVYFATRLDLPTTSHANSNLVEQVHHSHFVPYKSDCELLCPTKWRVEKQKVTEVNK